MDREWKSHSHSSCQGRARGGVKAWVRSWPPVPLRKIPCLSGHLSWLAQQPGQASGNGSPSPLGLLLPHPSQGRPQRGPVGLRQELGGTATASSCWVC